MMGIRKASFWVIFSLVLLGFSAILHYCLPDDNPEKLQQHFKVGIQHQNTRLQKEFEFITQSLEKQTPDFLFQQNKLKHQYFIAKADSIYAWNSNEIKLHDFIHQSPGILHTKEGWYLLKQQHYGDYTLYGVALIKRLFPVENALVQNYFAPEFKFSSSTKIAFCNLVINSNCISIEGISIQLQSYTAQQSVNKVLLGIELLGLFMLFYGIILWINQVKTPIQWGILIACLVLIRWTLLKNDFPFYIDESYLFNPSLYAWNSLTPSLGELFLHLIWLGFLLRILRKLVQQYTHFWLQLITLITLFCIQLFTLYVALSLVQNASFNADLSKIIHLDVHAWLVYLFLSSLFLLSLFTYSKVFPNLEVKRSFLWFFVCAICIVLWLHTANFWVICLSLAYPVLWYGYFFKNNWRYSLSFLTLLLFTFQLVYLTQIAYKKKFVVQTHDFFQKQSEPRNPLLDYLIVEELNKLTAYLQDGFQDTLDLNFIKENLIELPGEFEFKLGVCFSDYHEECVNDYEFSTKIEENEWYTLYYNLLEPKRHYTWIVKHQGKNYWVLMLPKTKNFAQSLPLLLSDKNISHPFLNEVDLSFAQYKNQHLQFSKGKYVFPHQLSARFTSMPFNELVYVTVNDQFFYAFNNGKKIFLLYVPPQNISEVVSPYSYFFMLIALLYLLLNYVKNYPNLMPQRTLKNKLLWGFMGILFLIALSILLGSVYFLKNQYNYTSFAQAAQKIQSVAKSVEKKLNSRQNLRAYQSVYLHQLLEETGKTLGTDISLFDEQGKLVSSNRLRIYEKGILPNYVNPKAFYALNHHQNQWIQLENIRDKIEYLAAYQAIYNKNNQLMGIVQLPYFSDIGFWHKEINETILNLINLYLLIFLLSALLLLIVSQRITKPLAILQENMKGLSIGGRNQRIAWESDDEIGKLIEQYNQMIGTLEVNAQLLAQQEREGAWRTMAQQVAHEIKNPLTPMKLNLQYFESIWDRLSPEARKEKFKEMNTILIEQIEALSNIASAFSSFAKMPKGAQDMVNLYHIILQCVELNNKDDKHQLKVVTNTTTIEIMGNKEELSRVFHNLIKNAQQAIPDNRIGEIMINCYKNDREVMVMLEDNGLGISEEIKNNIFTPNFTTKNSGMGLGLAMVKQIVDAHQGKISFVSSPNGTTFTIKLPLAAKNI